MQWEAARGPVWAPPVQSGWTCACSAAEVMEETGRERGQARVSRGGGLAGQSCLSGPALSEGRGCRDPQAWACLSHLPGSRCARGVLLALALLFGVTDSSAQSPAPLSLWGCRC